MDAQTEVFSAIAAPVRRQMLDLMAEREVPVSELVAHSGLAISAVSQHLAVLREAGLVTVRKQGRHRLYKADPQPLKAVANWVERYVPFWTDRLDALTRHLEETRNGED